MKKNDRRILTNKQRRIQTRLRRIDWPEQDQPMLQPQNIHYEMSERTQAISAGGIGAIHKLVGHVGLIPSLNSRLGERQILKRHVPYSESDHVLNIAYNRLAGGTCLEHIDRLRSDETYLNALGVQRIPDQTTAGDFCRRFEAADDVQALMDSINECRVTVWKKQPPEFFQQATIDVDGSVVGTTGECKEGMDIAYDGQWGYQTLVVTLAETQEPLYLLNRPGNRPSHEGAAEYIDRAVELCKSAGFARITVRGDTDFSQTKHLDRWDDGGVRFIFGYDANATLCQLADALPASAHQLLAREPKYQILTAPRTRPENVKAKIIEERGFEVLRLNGETVAEFPYQPRACQKPYRMIVVAKTITHEKGQKRLFEETRYQFYITNDWDTPARGIVREANARGEQEDLIGELKHHVRALHSPLDNLMSNWAYMVIMCLAWSLKTWLALMLTESGRWKEKHAKEKRQLLRMSFSTFQATIMQVPAQIVRAGRRTLFRLLNWSNSSDGWRIRAYKIANIDLTRLGR